MDFLRPADVDHMLEQRGESAMNASLKRGMPHGYEVGDRHFCVNGRVLAGERVMLHVLNASATEIRSLALPGHSFTIMALDGNPVPTPAVLPALWIGTAERVSALIEMNCPGVWILGDLADKKTPMFRVREGRRYGVRMRHASDDIHPVHLHRHSFELTRIAGKATAGVMKDVVMLGGYQELEFVFVAGNPGLTLFHCHQQLHMDFGFMALFDYV